MRSTKIAIAALVGVLALGLGSSAQGQGFLNLNIGKHKRGKHFNLNIGFPTLGHGHQHHHPRPIIRPVHVHASCCYQVIPGHFETIQDRVWVPGVSQQIWVPAVYETRLDHCGRPIQVLVAAGYFRTECSPGHWDLVQRQVWVPATQRLICAH